MSGQLLVRSAIEIARTLDAIRESGYAVSASVESGEVLFMSRLLQVDADGGHIVMACSEVKHANSALLAEKQVTFRCNHAGTHYEFPAAAPHETQHAGAPAIQFVFPSVLLSLQRRSETRIAVPPRVPLRCEVSLGPVSFDAHVVDISLKGLGALIYDLAIHLEPGIRLKQARITYPQCSPVVVDLVLRHITKVMQRDGSYVNRAGCLFEGAPNEIEDLVRLFVTELGT